MARRYFAVWLIVQGWIEALDPLTPTVAIMGTARKHPVPDLVENDIRALWRSWLSVRVPECQILQMMAYLGLAQHAL